MSWYDTESWYAPKETPQPQPEAAAASKPKEVKKTDPTGRLVWTGLIAALLIVAVVLGVTIPKLGNSQKAALPAPEAERDPNASDEWNWSWNWGKQGDDSGEDPSFGRDVDPGTEKKDEQADPVMPEDWTEFFKSYYQETDTASADVKIQRSDPVGDIGLQLKSVSGPELTLQQLYEKCAPSIVAISGFVNGESGYNWGTGVVLTADGLILTNTHVVDGCDRATVTLHDDREFEAKLIGADTISDLCVLQIEAKDLVPAEFGESASLRVGDPVAAIGNPLGDTFRSTLTDGIISAISRDISYKGRSMTLLQTNTALNEGNSGGALFNMHGQVVGITNMKMMSSYSSIEGIGFAIPSTTVREVVNSIGRFGEVRGRPSIGITVGAIPEEAESKYELPKGLYVTDVQPNSDAWAKGVRPGDILMEVNGTPVLTTADVSDIKNQFTVGDSLHFTIWRSGQVLEFDVLLMENNDVYGG